MTTSVITKQDTWKGNVPILWWMEFRHVTTGGAPLILEWSNEVIPDPSTYAGGPKSARMVNFGALTRKLSDRYGRLEAASLSVTVDDTDHTIRSWFADPTQRNVLNVEVSVYVRRGPDRGNGILPAPIWHGLVKAYASLPGLKFRFDAWDPISALAQQDFPQVLIGTYFPLAPTANLTRLGPRRYGLLSDEPASGGTGAPTPAAEAGTGCTVAGTSLNSPVSPGDGAYGLAPTGAALAGFSSVAGVAGAPGAPTALSVAWTPGSGGSPGNWWGNNLNAEGGFRFQVRNYNGSIPSDPYPFLPDDPAGFSDPGTVNVQPTVTFSGGTGTITSSDCASGQIAAIGSGSDGVFLVDQILAGASPAFLNQTPHASLPPIDPLTIAAGAMIPTAIQAMAAVYIYVATALTGAGEGPAGPYWLSRQSPWIRPNRLCWSPVAGALSYYVYRATFDPTTGTIGTFSLRWSVPLTSVNGSGNLIFTDDMMGTGSTPVSGIGGGGGGGTAVTQGLVPLFNVGPGATAAGWTDLTGMSWPIAMCYSDHACAASPVPTLYSHDSSGNVVALASLDDTQVSCPGRTGYAARWGSSRFTVVGGRRWFLVFLAGALAASVQSGSLTIWMNGGGVESVGDGTGTRLDSPADFMAHMLDNDLNPLALGIPGYTGTNWATTVPTWGDGRTTRDVASFTTVKTALTDLLGTDIGALHITEATAIPDVIAALALDCDLAYGPNAAGAFHVAMERPDPTSTPTPDITLTDISEIKALGLTWTDQVTTDYAYNQLQYQFGPTEDASGSQSYPAANFVTTNNGPAQTVPHGRVIQASEVLSFTSRRNAHAVLVIATRLLARAWPPPRDIVIPTGVFAATATDLGGLSAITDLDGAGATGFLAELAAARGFTVTPDAGEVEIDARDLAQEFTDMLAGDLKYLGGDGTDQITLTTYPSGGTGDMLHHGSKFWLVDSVNLPGTYQLEVMGVVGAGVTLTIGFFNMDLAPNTPIVEVTVTTTLPTRVQSATITFAAPGTAYNYGIKVKVSTGIGFAYCACVVRTS